MKTDEQIRQLAREEATAIVRKAIEAMDHGVSLNGTHGDIASIVMRGSVRRALATLAPAEQTDALVTRDHCVAIVNDVQTCRLCGAQEFDQESVLSGRCPGGVPLASKDHGEARAGRTEVPGYDAGSAERERIAKALEKIDKEQATGFCPRPADTCERCGWPRSQHGAKP